MTRTLVRTDLCDGDIEGRAVLATFLSKQRVLVITNNGEARVITQAGMVDAWDELWHDIAIGLGGGGWEQV